MLDEIGELFMDILVYRWHAWNQLDTELALTRLGHRIIIWDTSPDSLEEDEVFTENFARELRKTCCDFAFSINFFPVLADACYQNQTPYVCWNCDGSLLAMYHQSVFYDTNWIFTFDKACWADFQQRGVPHIFHLPLGFADCNRQTTSETTITSDAYPISFVGSLYTDNSFDRLNNKLSEYLNGYLDGILNAQQQLFTGSILELLLTPEIAEQLEAFIDYQKSSRSFADITKLFSTTVLGFKSANIQRTHCLDVLSRMQDTPYPSRVHLFSQSSTDQLPNVICHPPIDYHQEMPYVFQHSKINLNFTIPTIPTGIPLRVWDIMGHGGFLLTNCQPELMDHFIPAQDFHYFESEQELLEKASFYLQHDTQRQAIARNGQKKVLQSHTLTHRLEQLFSFLPF